MKTLKELEARASQRRKGRRTECDLALRPDEDSILFSRYEKLLRYDRELRSRLLKFLREELEWRLTKERQL